jgi:hypothetical protein
MMEIVASDALCIPLTYKLALCLYVYDISSSADGKRNKRTEITT